jgi:hypothetical protein
MRTAAILGAPRRLGGLDKAACGRRPHDMTPADLLRTVAERVSVTATPADLPLGVAVVPDAAPGEAASAVSIRRSSARPRAGHRVRHAALTASFLSRVLDRGQDVDVAILVVPTAIIPLRVLRAGVRRPDPATPRGRSAESDRPADRRACGVAPEELEASIRRLLLQHQHADDLARAKCAWIRGPDQPGPS